MSSLLDKIRRVPKRLSYDEGPRLASWLRKRWVLLRNPHATIQFNGPVYLGPGFSLHIPDEGATLIVGGAVEFRRGFRCEISNGGKVVIGDHSRFTYDAIIQCSTSIEIGDHCMFGQNAFIVDGNHRFRGLDRPMLDQGYDYRPLKIDHHVTVLTKVTIVSDIGERAVIGANAVVSRPVPAFTVAVGAPARPIDYFGPPGAEPPELARAAETAS